MIETQIVDSTRFFYTLFYWIPRRKQQVNNRRLRNRWWMRPGFFARMALEKGGLNMAIGLGTVLMILFGLVPLGAGVALVVLAFRALLKYIRCKDMDMRQKAAPEKRPLGEVLRARRTACNMTQEFVAGALGVSR